MKNSLETRLGIFVALAVVAAVLIIEVLGGVDLVRPGKMIKAQFNNVQDLKHGDRVKMAGVEIGRVVDISLTNAADQPKVLVTMKITKPHANDVKTDSRARVEFTGLMGQNFVSIKFGKMGSAPAEPGSILESDEGTDLNAVMQKIDSVAAGVQKFTDSISGDTIDNLLGPLTDFMKVNKDPLTATIANIRNVSSQISQGKGTVGRLIYEDTLYNSALSTVDSARTTITNLQDTASEIRTTVADARQVVARINSGQGTIGKLVTDEALYRETTASMQNFREILEKINHGQGTVGKLINEQEFYKNAKMTLQKVDQATEGLEDQGPLSVLGAAVGKLF